MVVKCTIEFDQNLLGIFYAGQMLSGSVILKADKPKDVKAIQLKILGYATTHFNERRLGEPRNFSARENYVESKTYLLGSDEDSTSTIRTGSHVYTFACQLPYNCPTSFEGRNGSIRYVAKVVLIRPWKYDQTYTRGFTVLKLVDLNYDTPQLRLPSRTSTYRSFCCNPCKTDPLQLELHLPQTGYVPGQLIPLSVLVINNTRIPVAEVRFSLVMQVRYLSQYPSRQVRIVRLAIAMETGDSVLRHCTRSLTQQLRVPATPPSCMRLCGILQIAYQVEVEAIMSGWHGKQVVSMPVTIGNVPLWSSNVVQQQPCGSQQNGSHTTASIMAKEAADELNEKSTTCPDGQRAKELPLATPIAQLHEDAATPTHMYSDMPPPTFEECTHNERGDMNADELHAFGPCLFAPLYPVYDVASPNNMSTVQTAETPNGGYDNFTYEN